RQTRVLLMPSAQETYGRVGLEAACSGIPTVATELAGLREALRSASVYLDRADLDAWVSELDRLTDESYYRARSEAARMHADAFDPRAAVATFEARLRRLPLP